MSSFTIEIEKKIKNEMLNQVLNSNGNEALMSLEKIIQLVSDLSSVDKIKNNNETLIDKTTQLDEILLEAENEMVSLENRMKLARENMYKN